MHHGKPSSTKRGSQRPPIERILFISECQVTPTNIHLQPVRCRIAYRSSESSNADNIKHMPIKHIQQPYKKKPSDFSHTRERKSETTATTTTTESLLKAPTAEASNKDRKVSINTRWISIFQLCLNNNATSRFNNRAGNR